MAAHAGATPYPNGWKTTVGSAQKLVQAPAVVVLAEWPAVQDRSAAGVAIEPRRRQNRVRITRRQGFGVMEDSRESRKGSRFAAGLPATLHIGGRDHPCTVHNLSRTGALLRGRFPEPTTAAGIEISLHAPHGGLSVRLPGRLVRSRKEGEDENRLALQFGTLDPEQRDRLETLIARVIEGHTPAPIETLKPGASPAEVVRALEQVPVAHRVALAARATPREREFLRQDPSPQVLEALVRNRSLLPAEARTLATLPHLLPTTLEILATDPRWSSDEELKVLLASHPRVSLGLARRIVSGLGEPSLRKLVQRPGINPTLRGELARGLRF